METLCNTLYVCVCVYWNENDEGERKNNPVKPCNQPKRVNKQLKTTKVVYKKAKQTHTPQSLFLLPYDINLGSCLNLQECQATFFIRFLMALLHCVFLVQDN